MAHNALPGASVKLRSMIEHKTRSGASLNWVRSIMGHIALPEASVTLNKIDNGTQCSARGKRKTTSEAEIDWKKKERKKSAIVPDASAGAEKLIKISISENKKNHKVRNLWIGKGVGTSLMNFPNKGEWRLNRCNEKSNIIPLTGWVIHACWLRWKWGRPLMEPLKRLFMNTFQYCLLCY